MIRFFVLILAFSQNKKNILSKLLFLNIEKSLYICNMQNVLFVNEI